MAEARVRSFKNELIRRQGPWRDVELATAEWVECFNTERPHNELDDFAPEVVERLHYAHRYGLQVPGCFNESGLRTRRGVSEGDLAGGEVVPGAGEDFLFFTVRCPCPCSLRDGSHVTLNEHGCLQRWVPHKSN